VDVVVFSAPQLSLFEAARPGGPLRWPPIYGSTLGGDKPAGQTDCDRMGYTTRIETAGERIVRMCFYQSYAREIAEANGWKSLATQQRQSWSTFWADMAISRRLLRWSQCVEAAVSGRLG